MKTVGCFLEYTSTFRPDYTCIFPADKDLSEHELMELCRESCVLETKHAADVLLASSIGMSPETVFFDTYKRTLEELSAVFGKCRYVVSSLEEIDAVNSLARDFVLPGRLETIGIRIIPAEENKSEDAFGIPEAQIPELSAVLRRSDYVAVKGVFIRPNTASNISANRLNSYFSLVKDFRSYLPCTLSYFCFERLIDRLSDDDKKQFADNLEIIRSLNDTSLYAQFLLS